MGALFLPGEDDRILILSQAMSKIKAPASVAIILVQEILEPILIWCTDSHHQTFSLLYLMAYIPIQHFLFHLV